MGRRYVTRAQLWRWTLAAPASGLGSCSCWCLALTVQAAANVVVMVVAALLLASALRPVMHGVRIRTPLPGVPIVLTIYVLMMLAIVTLVL